VERRAGGYAGLCTATLTITNTSDHPLQHGVRRHAVYDASPGRDLWVTRTPLGPGEQRVVYLTADFNAGRSGIATSDLVTHVLGYWNDPACFSAYDPLSPAQLKSVAIAVPNPFPYGP
jgi:hypothetical protein